MIGELRDDLTVYAMDRRGFDTSPDGSDYSTERLGYERQIIHSRPPGAQFVAFGIQLGARTPAPVRLSQRTS